MSTRIDLHDKQKSGKYKPLQYEVAEADVEGTVVSCWCFLVLTILCILIVYFVINAIRNTVDP